MKKLSTIKRGIFNVYFTNKDNTIKFPLNLSYLNYGTQVNLKDLVYYSEDESNSFPTINELLESGELIKHHYVAEHTINVLGYGENESTINFKAIQNEFKANGINVSMKGLEYVYLAWKGGYKVGYRGKGYHLFAPCGRCNPCSITATKADPYFKSWQKTYIC